MANLKSSKKRALTNEVRHQRNLARGSEIKTETKKVMEALAAKDLAAAKEIFKKVESKVARAQGKGLFKRATASRKISRLAKRIAQASATK